MVRYALREGWLTTGTTLTGEQNEKSPNNLHFEQNAKPFGHAAVGTAIDENVRTVLKEKGIETSHIPKHISEYDINDFDSVHVMTQRQKITLCSYFKNKIVEEKIVVLEIEDPYYKGIEAYRIVRDRFEEYYTDYIKENI